MMKKLFQPFTFIAGMQALGLGMMVVTISTILNFFSHNHFDGLLDAHTGLHTPFWIYATEPLVYLSVPICLFYIAGRLIAIRPFRFIDVAGTQILARWPMLFIAMLAFFLPDGTFDLEHIPTSAIFIGLVDLLFTAWFVALLYQSFTVSCNVKGAKAIAAFIVTLLLSEVAVYYTIHFIYKHFII